MPLCPAPYQSSAQHFGGLSFITNSPCRQNAKTSIVADSLHFLSRKHPGCSLIVHSRIPHYRSARASLCFDCLFRLPLHIKTLSVRSLIRNDYYKRRELYIPFGASHIYVNCSAALKAKSLEPPAHPFKTLSPHTVKKQPCAPFVVIVVQEKKACSFHISQRTANVPIAFFLHIIIARPPPGAPKKKDKK